MGEGARPPHRSAIVRDGKARPAVGHSGKAPIHGHPVSFPSNVVYEVAIGIPQQQLTWSGELERQDGASLVFAVGKHAQVTLEFNKAATWQWQRTLEANAWVGAQPVADQVEGLRLSAIEFNPRGGERVRETIGLLGKDGDFVDNDPFYAVSRGTLDAMHAFMPSEAGLFFYLHLGGDARIRHQGFNLVFILFDGALLGGVIGRRRGAVIHRIGNILWLDATGDDQSDERGRWLAFGGRIGSFA